MKKTIAVLGTFDTKGEEYAFVIETIRKAGAEVLAVDAGINGPNGVKPDVTHDKVAAAAGVDIQVLIEKQDRGAAVAAMTKGAALTIEQLWRKGRIDGIISLGGTAGTTIGTTAMQRLPIGFPKMMVSTVASGDTRHYVGEKDIVMMNSVVDISGINRISSRLLTMAAYAIVGMANAEIPETEQKPLIAATMFGVTTPCIMKAREYLENAGYEVLVFHATGSGGRAMEALIEAGMVDGVLDVTTTEWCDELVGGVLNAGPRRLDAAAAAGVPQIVSVGALDMVNFGPPDTVQDKFKGRNFYPHNPTVTLMRTTVEENIELGKIIGKKISASTGPCVLFLPLAGVSMIDTEGGAFYGPEEDKALFKTLRENCGDAVKIVEMDNNINDDAFALAMAKKLDEMLKQVK